MDQPLTQWKNEDDYECRRQISVCVLSEVSSLLRGSFYLASTVVEGAGTPISNLRKKPFVKSVSTTKRTRQEQ
jgi:hypothetical protein